MQRSDHPFEDPPEFGSDGTDGVHVGPLVLRAVLMYPVSVAFLAILGLAIGLFMAMVRPNLYSSEAKLQVRLGAREQRTAEGAITDEFQRLGSNVAIGDVMHVFADPMLHERVAEIVGVESILQPSDPTTADDDKSSRPVRWMHQLQGWWNEREFSQILDDRSSSPSAAQMIVWKILESGVVISSSPLDNTIRVGFTAQSPERAQEIVEAYLDVFQARHKEIFDSASQFSFIEHQLESAVSEAEELAKQFEEERLEYTVFDIAAQTTELHRDVEVAAALIESEQTDLVAASQQLALLDEQYESVRPTTSREPTRTLVVNTDYSTLIDQQRETQQLIDDVASHFPEGSVGYESGTASLKKRLVRIEEELAANERFVQLGDDAPVLVENRLFNDVATTRLSLEQQIGGLTARIEKRTSDLEAKRERLTALFAIQPQYEALEADLGRAEERVAALRPVWDRARMLRDVENDDQLSNIKVVQNPTLDPKKVGPNRKKFILMGLFAGIVLGLGSAVLRRLLDTTVRYADEVEHMLGVPVLGAIPETRKWRRWGRVVSTRSRA